MALSDNKRKLETLLAEVEAGSQDAAWELIEKYGPHVKAVVRSRMNRRMRRDFDSDDFVQAVWASFIHIRPRLNNLDDSRQFIRLLAKIAQNKVVDEVRRGQRTPGPPPPHFPQRSGPVFEPEELAHRDPAPSQFAIARERWKQLVARQNERNRRILELRIAGNTYDEIADEVGVSERTVRRVVHQTLELSLGRQSLHNED